MSNGPHASRKTTIYVLLALVTLIAGIAVILWGMLTRGQSSQASEVLSALGTSMAAGGLSALALGVMRYLDDRDEDGAQVELERIRETIGLDGAATREAVARTIRIDASAALRCVSDLAIGEEFRNAYLKALNVPSRQSTIDIDVVGLKLHRFLLDQLDWLIERKAATTVRLLLQKPGTSVFNAICETEGRSPVSTAKDLQESLKMLAGATVAGKDLTWSSGRVRVYVRFYDKYQPITLFRVGGEIMARPRVATPRGAATRFYESYRLNDSPAEHAVYRSHFDWCWDGSEYEVGT